MTVAHSLSLYAQKMLVSGSAVAERYPFDFIHIYLDFIERKFKFYISA